MGIKGLSTYLEQYYVPYKLQDTLIIVDGGLAINICLSSPYDPRFGGNYYRIYKKTWEIFMRFKSCNIIPIVVHDGRFKDEKAKTMRKRFDGKLKSAISYKDNRFAINKASSAISLLYANAFRHALKDLGIPYCCTEFEADEEMMELSRKLNCPVVSCDSDFYLCDGVEFIHWDSINFHRGVTKPYLECWKFHRTELLRREGVSPSVFPFLSVLFASDYSAGNYFGQIFRTVKKEERFQAAMSWLKGKTVEQVKEELTRCLPSNASQNVIQEFQNEINVTINSYIDCKTTVVPILEKNALIRPYLQNVPFNVQTSDVIQEYNVPLDVVNKIKECILTSTILDFFVGEEFECKTINCEDVDEESAHTPSIRLIEGIYGILAKYLPDKSISLRIRNFRKLETRELRPLLIKNTDPYKILFEIMEINENLTRDIQIFDGKWLIFILTLIYWRKKYQDRINDRVIHSVILSAFALHIVEIHYLKANYQNSNFPLNHFHDLSRDECKTFANKKINTLWIEKKNQIKLDDISHIHLYLSFQACLHRSQPLFPLLDLPYDIKISNFICGDFYNMIYNKMKKFSSCSEYMNEFFRGFDRFRELYDSILSNRAVADLL